MRKRPTLSPCDAEQMWGRVHNFRSARVHPATPRTPFHQDSNAARSSQSVLLGNASLEFTPDGELVLKKALDNLNMNFSAQEMDRSLITIADVVLAIHAAMHHNKLDSLQALLATVEE